MSKEIIKRIVEWVEEKEPWHRDAIRRIYQAGHLIEDDVNELEVMCLKHRGVPVPKGFEVPVPCYLKTADIQDVKPAHLSVILKRVSDVKNVNNLVEGQTLTFGESGLSIVYGDNGAGKSGYSRVFKQVCRTRSKDKRILPNAFKEPPTEPPTARVDYKHGENDREILWSQSKDCPLELSNISLFDSECASVHVTEENALAFTPQGLDILPKLAELFRTLQVRIRKKLTDLEKGQPSFLKAVEKFPNTEVYRRLRNLSSQTDFGELKKAAKRDGSEKIRLKHLGEILSHDPAQQAKILGLRKDRLVQIKNICDQSQTLTSAESVETIKGLWIKHRGARQVADLSSNKLFTGEELPGVGGESWRILWGAARRYSTQDAYPDKGFPAVEDGAVCVLCQQPLSVAATKRLVGFEEYVKGETEKAAVDAEKALREALGPLTRMTSGIRSTAENRKELALENQDLSAKVKRALILNRWRRRGILRNINSGEWRDLPAAPESLDGELQNVIDTVEQKRKDAIKAADSDERAILEKELLELQAREWMESELTDIENEIKRLDDIEKLQSCSTGV